jgi:hypothetical protein
MLSAVKDEDNHKPRGTVMSNDSPKKGDKTRCHYSEVLSVVDGRLVSRSGMDGVYKVADAIVGPGVMTHDLICLQKPCAAILVCQHPQFARQLVKFSLDRAIEEWKQQIGEPVSPGQDKEVAERQTLLLQKILDNNVLPHLRVGDTYTEYVEVEHIGPEGVATLQGDWESATAKFFDGKEVIAIEA